MMAQAVSGQIYIVDDDPLVRGTIAKMLESNGFTTQQFGSADELLKELEFLERGCIITDLRMPGLSGLDLVRHMQANGIDHPVIVISGQADIALAVETMKAGAVEFLEKPLHTTMLLEAVKSSVLRLSQPAPPAKSERAAQIFKMLTRRQLDVLKGIVEGLPNKLIAHRLGLSPRTVEAYRAAIMDRTQAKSLSELVRLSIDAGL